MSPRKGRIASAGNAANHALEALRAKGYWVVLHHDVLLHAAFHEDAYASLTEEQFTQVLRSYRAFFDAIDVSLPEHPTRPELAALVNSFHMESEG